jgi:hypothetical protein
LIWIASIVMACLLASCGQASDETSNDPAEADRSGGTRHWTEEVDTATFEVTDSTIRLRSAAFPTPPGRIVNVLISGVEPSTSIKPQGFYAHHIVRFYVDDGSIEIVSISPSASDARSEKDPRSRLSAITGISPLHHLVRMDFEQAIKILDLIGYDDARSQFKRLRAMPSTKAGMVQRCYDQGMFIRSVLLGGIRRTNDVIGDLAVRAALSIVETDMTYDECSRILSSVQASGFGDDPKRIWVRVQPIEESLNEDT